MQKKHLVRVMVIDDTIVFLNNNQSIWKADPRIADALSRLSAISIRLHAADAAMLEGSTVGDKEAQEIALRKAVTAVMRLTDEVSSWALRQNLHALRRMVKCEASDILKMRHAAGITKLNQLFHSCEAEAPNIPGCTLTAEDFRAARACIDIYVGIKTDKAQKLNARVSVCESVPELLDAAIPIKKELDLLIRRFATDHPEFFSQYKVTRKARQTGGRKAVRQKAEKPAAAETEKKDAPKVKEQSPKAPAPVDNTDAALKAEGDKNEPAVGLPAAQPVTPPAAPETDKIAQAPSDDSEATRVA